MAEVVGVCLDLTRRLEFYNRAGLALEVGEWVVVQTDRGMQLAGVVVARREVADEDAPAQGICRVATEEDLARGRQLRTKAEEALAKCRAKIAEHKLPMRLVGAEYTFDERKLVFYFTAEGRVDFRRLVKELASTFRVRIELLHIGVRDAARMQGGLGSCGRALCCAVFAHEFQPVSIRMAKEQGASLNPSRITGACGRLKCCMRYEHETYKEALRGLPRPGATVVLEGREVRVVEVSPLKREVSVDLGEQGVRWVSAEALTVGGGQESKETD